MVTLHKCVEERKAFPFGEGAPVRRLGRKREYKLTKPMVRYYFGSFLHSYNLLKLSALFPSSVSLRSPPFPEGKAFYPVRQNPVSRAEKKELPHKS